MYMHTQMCGNCRGNKERDRCQLSQMRTLIGVPWADGTGAVAARSLIAMVAAAAAAADDLDRTGGRLRRSVCRGIVLTRDWCFTSTVFVSCLSPM